MLEIPLYQNFHHPLEKGLFSMSMAHTYAWFHESFLYLKGRKNCFQDLSLNDLMCIGNTVISNCHCFTWKKFTKAFHAFFLVCRGSFKFVDTVTPNESYVGFQAHPPYIVHRKAYEFSKQMPTVLQFERLHRCSLWAELFQDDSPDGDDIALYFFPGRFGRSVCSSVLGLILLSIRFWPAFF